MTASRALRGLASVKSATRDRVMEAAKSLGAEEQSSMLFHRRAAGGKGSDHRLKILIPRFREHKTKPAKELSDRFSSALAETLEQNGGQLEHLLCQNLEQLIRHYQKGRFHALVIRDTLPTSWFQKLSRVATLISAVSNDYIPGCDCVLLNESRAATTILQQLVKRGHERVAWFGINDTNYIKMLEEIDPLRDSLGQIHVVRYAAWNTVVSMGPETKKHRTLYLTRDHDKDSLEAVVQSGMEKLFQKTPQPTAIVVPTEIVAVTLIKLLQERGIDVPQDCSVVSYGRTSISRRHRPTLAGIRTNFDELARTVPELITRRRADPKARPISVALEADFERGSSLGTAPEQQSK